MSHEDLSASRAVLFDLDGTLLDTAPDMVGALNHLLGECDRPPVEYSVARNHVSHGAIGLMKLAWQDPDDLAIGGRLHRRYLEVYAERLSEQTTLFDGMSAILDMLEQAGVPWGVVTNKPHYLTQPLLEQLALAARCATVVSGDTLPERKPHPAPLLHALSEIGIDARDCGTSSIYVGDARRDIEAGNAAGMDTVSALWGYIPPDDDPASWGADENAGQPADLHTWLQARLAGSADGG